MTENWPLETGLMVRCLKLVSIIGEERNTLSEINRPGVKFYILMHRAFIKGLMGTSVVDAPGEVRGRMWTSLAWKEQ